MPAGLISLLTVGFVILCVRFVLADNDALQNVEKSQFDPVPKPVYIDCQADAYPQSEKECDFEAGPQGGSWQRPGRRPNCTFPCDIIEYMVGYDLNKQGFLQRRNTTSLYGNDSQMAIWSQKHFDGGVRLEIAPSPYDFDGKIVRRKIDTKLPRTNPQKQFQINISPSPFGIQVVRRDNGIVIFDTTKLPGLTISTQFIQISAKLDTNRLYGWGEQYHDELMRVFDWRRWSVMPLDQGPYPGTNNLYGHHPFLMGLDANNDAYGIYLHNTHPMDLQLQPNPNIITYRVVGGSFDFYFFAGPTPVDVIQQYTAIIGRPAMPPYWYLGFQLSRYGYRNVSYLQKVWDRNRLYSIPQDVQVTDIDYMWDKRDFTVDKHGRYRNFSTFLTKEIHGTGRKWIPIVDPAISAHNPVLYKPLRDGLRMKIFLNDSRSPRRPLETKVWPGKTYFPDFSNPRTQKYWYEENDHLHRDFGFDGIWLDMNEPSNFVDGSTTGCAKNSWNYPPYIPVSYRPFYKKTICMDALMFGGKLAYEWRNWYGHFEIKQTYQTLLDIIPGYTGFVKTLVVAMEFSMFGFSMIGSDICGFGGNTNEELCVRWHQVGAFYTYCRNHNDLGATVDQDPGAWGGNAATAIGAALVNRYAYLPVLYTLMYRAHTTGIPVIRGLMFNYPKDSQTHHLRDQLMWGRDLLIVPILNPNQTERIAYFPDGIWYRVDTLKMEVTRGPTWKTVGIALDAIGLWSRGGSIFPLQPAWDGSVQSTVDGRRTSWWVNVLPNATGDAVGELYWDDGESLSAMSQGKYCLYKFYYRYRTKIARWWMEAIHTFGCNDPNLPEINNIIVGGFYERPDKVYLNGKEIPESEDEGWQFWGPDNQLYIVTEISLQIMP